MTSYVDEERIRRRVEKRLKARQGFLVHLLVMTVLVPFVWVLWSLLGNSLPPLITSMGGPDSEAVATFFAQFPAPLLLLVVAAFTLIIHGLILYLDSRAETHREDAIQREIERERQRLYGDAALGKPKRRTSPHAEQRASLSDDGELVYDDEAQDDAQDEPERRRSSKAAR